MKTNKIFDLKFIFFLLGVCLGLFIGLLYIKWDNLIIDPELNIIELANLIATVFIVIIIQMIFRIQKDNFLKAKDLYLKRLEEINHQLDDILDIVQKGRVDFTVITCKIKLLLVSYIHLKELLVKKHSQLNGCGLILKEIQEMKELLTNTPKNGEPGPDDLLSVVDNILHIHGYRRGEIEKKVGEIKRLILELNISVIEL
jgi:hypothetical protein